MKKIKNLLLLFVLLFVLTGCVKFNANMDIKKDKSMDFSIIYAFDTSAFGNQEILTDANKKELESKGFIVSDYTDGNMKGFKIVKKIKNIDDVSTTSDYEYDLSGMMENTAENKYFFKVKKGFLKNTYTAKFKFDSSDSGLNSLNDNTLDDTDYTFDDNNEETFDNEPNIDFNNENMDFSNMMANLDLSFNVNLPYGAKNSNSTTTSNKNKTLSWNLYSNNTKLIEFEFDMYNMTIIYIGAGILALLIIVIILVIVNKKKNSKINEITPVTNEVVENLSQDVQIQQNPIETQSINQSTENQNNI